MQAFGSRWATWVACAVLAMLFFLGVAVKRSNGQSIEGHSVGDTLSGASIANAAAPVPITATSLGTAAKGVVLTATLQVGSNKIVRLDAKWRERPAGVSAYFADFRFGTTTLAAIRSRFGSKGVLSPNEPPVQARDGDLNFVTSYEVKDSKQIVSFTSSIDQASLRHLHATLAEDLYDEVADVAVLTAIALVDRDAFIAKAGPAAAADIGYQPVAWIDPSVNAASTRVADLSRIKLSQLPAFRIYTGPNNMPDFTGHSAVFQTFAARIAEGMSKGPVFAGEFAIVRVSCGHDCVNVFAGNVRTGEVFRFPLAEERVAALKLRYSLDSRMMVAQWRDTASQSCIVQVLDFENDEWIPLFRHTIGSSSLCARSIKVNLQP